MKRGVDRMETKLKLPVGIEFFKDIRTRGYYYVDKTGLIRDLLRGGGSVSLITRPRRFGKSLNMDMLKAFFETGTDEALFEGLEIAKEQELCRQYMGKFPVVSLSLKDVEGEDFQTACDQLEILISEEAERFAFLLESDRLAQTEKQKLSRLMEGEFEKQAYLHNSLRLLTRLLYKHYNRQVIVLIDEYDVPLDKAYYNGYYPKMVSLIRSLLSQGLKTNPYLHFAVITGCLRIARESIFTGFNNFKVRSLTDEEFAAYFGFTDTEVADMLKYYGVQEAFEKIKKWYDGYRIGGADVYCPWDVVNQCDKLRISMDAPMEAYWANSSSNAIVREILEKADAGTKDQIEALISGECITKELMPELTYTDLDSRDAQAREDYLWSVLFASGYLTEAADRRNGNYLLRIPNLEVQGIYEKKIRSWFQMKITGHTQRWEQFCQAVKSGNADDMQKLFQEFLDASISIRDTCVHKEKKENFYHGILLGLLQSEGSWVVKSNAESGIGYTDILIMIPAERKGCVIEVKYAEKGAFDAACAKAVQQIKECGYERELFKDGIQTVYQYGIACYKKSCKIVKA